MSLPAQAGTTSYLEYFFPGTVVMILLFTAIFSTISIIEDRREGFHQAVLVAPVGRSTIVMGKMLGSTSLALIQGILFLALAPFVGVAPSALPLTIVLLALVAFGLTGLGYVLAWSLDSTQGFHAIMNLFLIPMWLLSGAVFPASGAPGWLQWVITVNPLTYGVGLVRWSLYGPEAYASLDAPDPGLSLVVVIAFALLTFVLALKVTLKKS
jgi:ABC-2 type transport system permease protein